MLACSASLEYICSVVNSSSAFVDNARFPGRDAIEEEAAFGQASAPSGGGLPRGRGLREEHQAMTSRVAKSIRRGLEQAVLYPDGQADASRYGVRVPEEIDVKAIRAKLGMTQEQFAGRFGFSIKTLRHWEQGLRVPEGPTRAYLLVIDRNPKAVQKALRSA